MICLLTLLWLVSTTYSTGEAQEVTPETSPVAGFTILRGCEGFPGWWTLECPEGESGGNLYATDLPSLRRLLDRLEVGRTNSLLRDEHEKSITLLTGERDLWKQKYLNQVSMTEAQERLVETLYETIDYAEALQPSWWDKFSSKGMWFILGAGAGLATYAILDNLSDSG